MLSNNELLTNEEQYRGITKCLPHLTRTEEATLIAQARTGDKDAREKLIMGCLNYVGSLANRYKQYLFHDEYLDLVGEGNLAVVEAIDRALTKDNPCGYLRGAAKNTIIHYCYTRANLIVRPDHSLETVCTTSLDEKSYTYDILACRSPMTVKELPDYSSLYAALKKLPKAYQEVLIKQFGLYDSQPESLYAMSRKTKDNAKGTVAYNAKYRALKRLRKFLTQQEGKIRLHA